MGSVFFANAGDLPDSVKKWRIDDSFNQTCENVRLIFEK